MSHSPNRSRTGKDFWDLIAVVLAAVMTVVLAFYSGPKGSFAYLQVPLGFLFAFIFPGYAIMAALFPASGGAVTDQDSNDAIDGIERVVLSLGLSIAVVPMVGLFWNFTPWGIELVQVLGSVAGVTIVAVIVAFYRRWQLPSMQRFKPGFSAQMERLLRAHRTSPRIERLLNIVIALLLVSSVAGLAVGITFPGEGEQYTEFYLLSEDPETGNLTASGYPTEFKPSNRESVVVGIENNEQRTVNYTVVVELQRLARGQTTIVAESSELDRFSLVLAEGETFQQTRSLETNMIGQNLRLVFLLYKGTPPEESSVDNAYRQVHFWVDVKSSP